jgi:hypothetical protein
MALPFLDNRTPEQRLAAQKEAAVEAGAPTVVQQLTGSGPTMQYFQKQRKQSYLTYSQQKEQLRRDLRMERIETKKNLEKQVKRIQQKYNLEDMEKRLRQLEHKGDTEGASSLRQHYEKLSAKAEEHIEPLQRHTWKNFDMSERDRLKDLKMSHRLRMRGVTKDFHSEVQKRRISGPFSASA